MQKRIWPNSTKLSPFYWRTNTALTSTGLWFFWTTEELTQLLLLPTKFSHTFNKLFDVFLLDLLLFFNSTHFFTSRQRIFFSMHANFFWYLFDPITIAWDLVDCFDASFHLNSMTITQFNQFFDDDGDENVDHTLVKYSTLKSFALNFSPF